MSSDSASSGSAGSSPEADPKDGALAETTECPACGRRFVGDYCPDCGQEAEPSASTGGILEDFARELFDIEQGFLETLKALTVRPGRALRDYLDGNRSHLMSPGRYLLAAILIHYAANQGLVGLGILAPTFPTSPEEQTVYREAVRAVSQFVLSQEGRVLYRLSEVGVLALLLWRLFCRQLRRGGQAVALASYLVAHSLLVASVVYLAYLPATFVISGGPVGAEERIYTVVLAGYLAWGSYGSFGPGWKAPVKGLFAGVVSWIELSAIFLLVRLGWAVWTVQAHPDAALPGEHVFVSPAIFAVPLLLHAGVETYYRLR